MNLIAKSVFIRDLPRKIQKIAQKIEQAADYEENLWQEGLAYFVHGQECLTEDNVQMRTTTGSGANTFIDLTEWCNNKGFLLEEQNGIADLTGLGEYFVVEDPSLNSISSLEGLQFKLPDFRGAVDDNISCTEQSIDIDAAGVQEIGLLGCSEWGSTAGEIVIEYKDSSNDRIHIMLTDFSCEPMYGEEIVLKGRTQRGFGDKTTIMQKNAYVSAVRLPVDSGKTVGCIILPDNPSYHVLALSLVMGEEDQVH